MHSEKEVFNFDQCDTCDFVFLNPRVNEVDLKNYYTTYYLPYRGAEAWGKYKHIVEKSQKKLNLKRLKRVQDYHDLNANSLLLDIGCGQPSFLKTCYDQTQCKSIGIDFSDNGWINQKDLYKKLDLRIGETKDLPADLQPDVISMWHYLEHDYYPLENLKYLKLIAKPSTQLIIEIPNFDSYTRKKFGKNWAGWHTPRHTSLYSPNNIELLLKKSGWRVKKLMTYGTMDPYLLEWMSKMEEKNIEWNKNMEVEFYNFMKGMLLFLPKKLKEKSTSLGIMTIIAEPA